MPSPFRSLKKRVVGWKQAKAPTVHDGNSGVEEEPSAIELAKDFFAATNRHANGEIKNLCASTFVVKFVSSHDEMLIDDYLETMQGLVESFPDFRLDHAEYMEEKKLETDGPSDPPTTVVTITDIRASGTHTGKPFAFGPYPAIPASNIAVRDHAPCTDEMHIREGKIVKLLVKTQGAEDASGPGYFYNQIGGLLF